MAARIANFDLFRITKAKREVDMSTTTVRHLCKVGAITPYRQGKALWISRSELEAFIKSGKDVGPVNPPKGKHQNHEHNSASQRGSSTRRRSPDNRPRNGGATSSD